MQPLDIRRNRNDQTVPEGDIKMILLTGVTGQTGGATARELIKQGVPFRALVRDENKAEEFKNSGVELLAGDLGDQSSVREALQGVEKATLILPNDENQQAMEMQFVDIAAAEGVKHIVKMSSYEAREDATSPIPAAHYAVEQYMRNSGVGWTMVRPNFFMQNFLGSGASIKANNQFTLPMGNGVTVMIDCRDIGAAIAEVLTGEGHVGQSYDISGPEKLSFYDVAERFSEVLGREIKYIDEDPQAFRERVAPFMRSEWHLNAVCHLFSEIVDGVVPPEITTTFRELVGREPVTLKQFIQDFIFVFQD
jgi:uncharacterized protein YbjT (DUF2867 family)